MGRWKKVEEGREGEGGREREEEGGRGRKREGKRKVSFKP